MHKPLLCSLICGLLILSGCQDQRPAPSIPGPITKAPPATAHADAGVQTAVADVSNAVASKDPVKIVAAKTEYKLEEQQQASQPLNAFFPLAVLAFVIAAVLFYMKDFTAAGGAAVASIAATYGTVAVKGAIAHPEALIVSGILAGVGFFAWRNRAKLEKDAETAAIALEHALAHAKEDIALWHPINAVQSLIQKAYTAVAYETKRLEMALHLVKKPAQSVDVTVTTTPPAPKV